MQEHITCMYPLLPAMKGANVEMIVQAMEELSILYNGNETMLSQEFAWMQVLLERAEIIPAKEKARLGEKLKMYDPLWEEHPRVKKIKAEAKANAKAEVAAEVAARIAKAEAEAKAEAMKSQLKRAMVYLVRVRFPELTELAQQSAQQIENPDILGFLLEKIESAENEAEAKAMLRPPAA